ncbi:hypothetical protein BV22DRAFT_984109, partial [Leucogyrophana mollusca]
LPTNPILLAACFLVVVLHVLAGVSRANSGFMLAALRAIIAATFWFSKGNKSTPSNITNEEYQLLKNLPKDLRSTL